MKKIFMLLFGLILFITFGCKMNVSESNTGHEPALGFSIKLPGSTSRTSYYGVNDASSYKLILLKNANEVSTKTGKPGETVKFSISEEGLYTIQVSAYNSENLLIAEGESNAEIKFGDGVVAVKVKLIPKIKSVDLEVEIEWGDFSDENELGSLLKTVTANWPEENDFFLDGFNYASGNTTMFINFYENNKFEIGVYSARHDREEDFAYTYDIKKAYAGTYIGNPLADNCTVRLDCTEDYWTSAVAAVSKTYKAGKTNIAVKDSDLTKTNNYGVLCAAIDGNTFNWGSAAADEYYGVSYSKNADGSTTVEVQITGNDAEKFKFSGGRWNNNTAGTFPVTITVSDDDLHYDDGRYYIGAFIDENGNNVCDDNEIEIRSWIDLKEGFKATKIIDVVKTVVKPSYTGNLSLFTNPKYINNERGSGSSSTVVADISSSQFNIYGDRNSLYGYNGYLAIFQDTNNNGLYDWQEPLLTDETFIDCSEPVVSVNVKLPSTAPQFLNKRIVFTTSSSGLNLTNEQKKHFGFYSTDSEITLYIPTGTGTDGEFITCYECENGNTDHYSGDHFWNLLRYVYKYDSESYSNASRNYEVQLSGFLDNCKDLINFLTQKKGFTVEGTDLIS